jgi:hypothetical protein
MRREGLPDQNSRETQNDYNPASYRAGHTALDYSVKPLIAPHDEASEVAAAEQNARAPPQ